VLTHDSSLTVLDASGKVVSHKALDRPARQRAADQLKTALDQAALSLARKHTPPDRVVKYAAAQGGLTAVGCWGGTLLILDGDGKTTMRRQMEQDITGLAWLGDRLIVALADGRLVALAAR